MVCEHQDRVVGFILYELHKKHIIVIDMVVDKKMQNTEIGTQMINKLKNKLSDNRRHKIVMTVPEHNLACHMFLKKNNFIASVVKDNGYLFEYFY